MASSHQRTDSSSSRSSSITSASNKVMATVKDFIILTPYPVEPGHTLITISRISAQDWKPEMSLNASFVAEGENAGIIINKPASIMDYNKIQAGQKERHQPPSAKMSFKVFLMNSETNAKTLEHRTLRFWLDHSAVIASFKKSARNKNNGLGNNDTTATTASNVNNNVGGTGSGDFEDNNMSPIRAVPSSANLSRESSQIAQAYFSQLKGSDDGDFPKNYVGFIMKLMRQLKSSQFTKIIRMEVEIRQLVQTADEKPPSPVTSSCQSPLTSQKVLDLIESSYPNPVSLKEICSTTQAEISLVKNLVDELAQREKINSTDDGQHFTRTLKPSVDTKIQMVKQMPKVQRSQQPVIAIITAQYCEKLAVDAMISDKETFVRYRVSPGAAAAGSSNNSSQDNDFAAAAASSNYVYTLGNIGDHRVVSTKLTSVGNSRGALIAAGNATTRLLGTFPEIEYVFLVGCSGGVPNYTDFSSHVRLGDIVVSHLPSASDLPSASSLNGSENGGSQSDLQLNRSNVSQHISAFTASQNSRATMSSKSSTPNDYVYIHCRPKLQENANRNSTSNNQSSNQITGSNDGIGGGIPTSYSVHKNLKRLEGSIIGSSNSINGKNSPPITTTTTTTTAAETTTTASNESSSSLNHGTTTAATTTTRKLAYDECHFRLWRPVNLDLQELAQKLWLQGMDNAKHRIWDYYIDEGIKSLQQFDVDAQRPAPETDKLFMSIGENDTIEVSHPEACEGELDLRRDGRPMCHFGPIGSGKPALANDQLMQQMISQFNLRGFDSEFDPVVESIYGNCKESYIMIRGISDYKDGRKKKEWQQYSALVAAAFMKSIIVNLRPMG